jgi:hypothetical protein
MADDRAPGQRIYVGSSSVDVVLQLDEPGRAYCLAQPASALAPTTVTTITSTGFGVQVTGLLHFWPDGCTTHYKQQSRMIMAISLA